MVSASSLTAAPSPTSGVRVVVAPLAGVAEGCASARQIAPVSQPARAPQRSDAISVAFRGPRIEEASATSMRTSATQLRSRASTPAKATKPIEAKAVGLLCAASLAVSPSFGLVEA